jgi:phosphoketolase
MHARWRAFTYLSIRQRFVDANPLLKRLFQFWFLRRISRHITPTTTGIIDDVGELVAIEELSSADEVCADTTGTLTLGLLTHPYSGDNSASAEVVEAGAMARGDDYYYAASGYWSLRVARFGGDGDW